MRYNFINLINPVIGEIYAEKSAAFIDVRNNQAIL